MQLSVVKFTIVKSIPVGVQYAGPLRGFNPWIAGFQITSDFFLVYGSWPKPTHAARTAPVTTSPVGKVVVGVGVWVAKRTAIKMAQIRNEINIQR
jgi:hypothetical protein